MHQARFILPLLAVVALAAAGCGGGGSAKLSSGDVAVVGGKHITLEQFDLAMEQAKRSYAQSGQPFPKQGTTSYQTIKSGAVNTLVQQAERAQKAAAMGIKATPAAIQKRLDLLKKQYFGGSEKKYEAQLKKQHLTDAQVRDDIRQQLVEEQLFAAVTKGVTVSNGEIQAYYAQHYAQQQTRSVQYILVKKKSLAETLYTQLKSGSATTWCTLAKKYSQDPSSAKTCGKATFSKGQTVPAFDTVLFSEKTDVTHPPVYDPQQYKAYFIIRPLSATKLAKATPLSQVKSTIQQTLLTQKKTAVASAWATNLEKSYCKGSKIRYEAGYEPSPDLCTSITTTAATTT
jgi:peptidyl-prolyl cis-trans isomerase C